jgi:hypothetical protein
VVRAQPHGRHARCRSIDAIAGQRGERAIVGLRDMFPVVANMR